MAADFRLSETREALRNPNRAEVERLLGIKILVVPPSVECQEPECCITYSEDRQSPTTMGAIAQRLGLHREQIHRLADQLGVRGEGERQAIWLPEGFFAQAYILPAATAFAILSAANLISRHDVKAAAALTVGRRVLDDPEPDENECLAIVGVRMNGMPRWQLCAEPPPGCPEMINLRRYLRDLAGLYGFELNEAKEVLAGFRDQKPIDGESEDE